MCWNQFAYRFTLDNNVAFAQEIDAKQRIHLLIVIYWMKRLLSSIGYALLFKLHLKTFLITYFIKACT